MTDHPSTFRAADTEAEGIDWNDHATIQPSDGGEGVLHAFRTINRGTMAEMVGIVSRMPEDERGNYVIQKAGDRTFEIGEIMALAARDDFPG